MGCRLGPITFAAMMLAGDAAGQVATPPNCHWVALPEAPSTIELWCRGEDGRARATGRTLQQGPAPASDGCPAGQLYDGQRCISEAAALAAAPQGPYIGPERPPSAGQKAQSAPRVLLFQDRDGRHNQGMACIDQRDVTICRPIPRR